MSTNDQRAAQFFVCATLVATLASGTILRSQELPELRGTVERVVVHGESLAGNLSGDSPDRRVSIYLPPSYQSDPDRRFPVVYMLHGFTDSEEKWFHKPDHWINLPSVIEQSLEGDAREMIVVMPNAFTRFQGSMYSNSAATGDWERFVAEELVAYVDSHYRTVASRAGRGLSGHSMGGYGTLRIGMKRPDVFSSIYALSPCCLAPDMDLEGMENRMAKAVAVESDEGIAEADFGTKAVLARAAAWSPNPKRPPLFLDLPWQDGETQPLVAARWVANSPIAQVDQYVDNFRQLDGLAFDAGNQDRGIAASIKVLDAALSRYGIAHGFEIYSGNHTNGVAGRIAEEALPFFSEKLRFE